MPTLYPLELNDLLEAKVLFGQHNHLTSTSAPISTKEEIIDKSVQGNILRVFLTGKMAPSVCYRTWAATQFYRLQEEIESSNTREDYDKIIKQYARDLAAHWFSTRNQKLPYGPATKIINLLVKTMYMNRFLELPSLPQFYNVPFDSYTLIPLMNIIDDLLPDRPYGIAMNRQITMNYVLNEPLYHDLQRAVRTLCTYVSKTPLDYELWAWDARH